MIIFSSLQSADFLFVLIELFTACVTVETLRRYERLSV